MSNDASRPRRAIESDDSAALSPESDSSSASPNPFARPSDDQQTGHPQARRSAAEPELEPEIDPDADTNEIPAVEPTRARRGAAPEPDDSPAEVESPAGSPVEPPGAEPSATMIPAPVLPPRGEGYYEDPGPQPRRSAMSSDTPPEADEAVTVGRRSASEPADETTSPDEPDAVVAGGATGRQSWFRAHAKSFAVAGVSVAVLATGAGAAGYYTAGGSAEPPAPASPSPSVSESDSPSLPRVEAAQLISEADAKLINANATWATASNTSSVEEHQARPACFSSALDDETRLDSLQRTLGTTQEDQLAVLHQLDSYPSVELAQEAFASRAQTMASCSESPARIVASDQVTGIGEEAQQVTVAFENEQSQYHNILLVRTGNILSMVDVSSNDAPTQTLPVANALERSVGSLCEATGECATGLGVTAQTVPAVEPRGWLIASDLPRITAGAGRWTAQSPAAVSSRGTGCEDLSLSSPSGATESLQNTYLMTQDEARPDQFGLDEMQFTFGDESAASSFADTLSTNLSECADRVMGTEVESIDVGESADAVSIHRETESGAIAYQVAVVQRGNRVAYLLTSVTDDYRFSDTQVYMVATRAGDRLTQA